MSNTKAIKLLKSGNFTIAYWDNGAAWLYKGKHKIEDFDGEIGSEIEPVEYDDFSDGYTPGIVALLVKALGGKVVSI
jgi:hypothetical protein